MVQYSLINCFILINVCIFFCYLQFFVLLYTPEHFLLLNLSPLKAVISTIGSHPSNMKHNPITDRFSLMNPVMWPNQIEKDSLQTHLSDTHQTGCFFNAFTNKSEHSRKTRTIWPSKVLFFSWRILSLIWTLSAQNCQKTNYKLHRWDKENYIIPRK